VPSEIESDFLSYRMLMNFAGPVSYQDYQSIYPALYFSSLSPGMDRGPYRDGYSTPALRRDSIRWPSPEPIPRREHGSTSLRVAAAKLDPDLS
jgi:hypothetical protein